MRKLILLGLLIPSLAFGQQQSFVRNDSNTSTLNGANLRQGSASVNDKGIQSTKITSEAGLNAVAIEDTVAGSGFAGIPSFGVINQTPTALAANGDYAALSLGGLGEALTSLIYDVNVTQAEAVVTKEDLPLNANQAVVLAGVQTQDPLAVDQTASNDVAHIKVDRAGRTITTLAPAGESFSNCSTSATGVVDVTIKAAVASNRSYVTSITCSNTAGAVSTELEIRDGTTVMDVGYVASTTLGESHWTKSYPVPLRGSVNTALNVRPVTTSSATRCCAQGYTSVN